MNGIAQSSINGSRAPQKRLSGVVVSKGVGVGPIHFVGPLASTISGPSNADPSSQLERFRDALDKARLGLLELTDSPDVAGRPVADIFEVHLLILDSASFVDRVESLITRDRSTAENAVTTAANEIAQLQAAAPDNLIAEKSLDIMDVSARLLRALGLATHGPAPEGSVIVIRELSPHVVLELAASKPAAIISEHGGWTSHASIIARELKIPVITGLHDAFNLFVENSQVLVDGNDGEIIIDPDPDEIERRMCRPEIPSGSAVDGVPGTLATADSVEITLRVNADNADVYDAAVSIGGHGIGLFRSEVTLAGNKGFPTEDEQYNIYSRIADATGEGGVRIRTFDVGTEQIASGDYVERNPSLGLKSIRLSLTDTDFFRTQIRALLRASYDRHVAVVLPMISGVGEILRSKTVIEEERSFLERSGIPFGDPSVGVMIELPSAVLMAREICEHSEFLCLGTNDLVQYLLAVDRDNEAVAEWYQSLHPAVIRALEAVVSAANDAGIPAAVCGEIAGSPFYVPLLLGLGIRELSVNVHSITQVRQLVNGIDLSDTIALAEQVKQAQTSAEIEDILREYYLTNWPHLFPPGLLATKHR